MLSYYVNRYCIFEKRNVLYVDILQSMTQSHDGSVKYKQNAFYRKCKLYQPYLQLLCLWKIRSVNIWLATHYILYFAFCINIDLWSKNCVYANKTRPITKLLISKYHEYMKVHNRCCSMGVNWFVLNSLLYCQFFGIHDYPVQNKLQLKIDLPYILALITVHRHNDITRV